jgi:hypothetical protein
VTDYGERERQFLDTLKADTGRTLEEWMIAITGEGLRERNEIIDWLRRQGFIMFSKASWIERIHNNGGKPIYADAGATRARPAARPPSPRKEPEPSQRDASETPPPPETTSAPAVAARIIPFPVAAPSPPTSSPSPTPTPPPAATPTVAASNPVSLDALLGRAKAYRPLAVYVIAEIGKAVPNVTQRLLDGGIAFGTNGREFAVLAITAKELKLGLALSTTPADTALEPARIAVRGAPAVTHMALLTDARQITAPLIAAIVEAAAGT